jgi:hypothetical protein
MIAWDHDGIMQNLARLGHHPDHIILGRIGRNGEPMKMQIRHVHARIYRTSLRRLGRKIVDVGDFENVTRGGTDHRSYFLVLECESVAAMFIDRVQRKGYNATLSSHLRRLRQRESLRRPESCTKQYL